MTVVTVDFANRQRDRERRLIVLSDRVSEGISLHDPSYDGLLTRADILEMESECRIENQENRLFDLYRAAVGGVVARDKIDAGLGNPQVVDFDAYLDSRSHARALAWARDYLERINASFGVKLDVRP